MKSILFIQYGDYREAYERFLGGGVETYRDQKRSVDFVSSLAPVSRTTTVTIGERNYRTELQPNLWTVGLDRSGIDAAQIARIFDEAAPSHVILRTPHIGFLREIRRRNLWLLPTFADIFDCNGLRAAIRNFAFRYELLRCQTPCVSNHSLNASRSLLTALNWSPEKIVPWDWSKVPIGGPAKIGVADPARPTAFFAGSLTAEKGVGDCLDAVAESNRNGFQVELTLAGAGDVEGWKARAFKLGIADQINFLGMIANQEVRKEMRKHDFVIVPSRHSYNEGLPNTIYEGLASRSVLVVSDHPAFDGRLESGEEVLVFPAENSKALANCIEQAARNSELYHKISENSARAHDRLYVGMEWPMLVEAFLEDPENRAGWVEENSLMAFKAKSSAEKK